ncbi:MAG: OadG family protein [Myxococcota bacterium]
MISEGLRLMAVGMLTVFAFLALLVGLMKASALFFEKFADRFPEEAKNEPAKTRAGNEDEIALVLALVEAARHTPRQRV